MCFNETASWIAFIGGIALIIVGSVDMVKNGMEAGLPELVSGIIITLDYLVIILLATLARRQVRKGKRNHRGFHVIMLVLGIIGFDIFYILGAIFGIVSRG